MLYLYDMQIVSNERNASSVQNYTRSHTHKMNMIEFSIQINGAISEFTACYLCNELYEYGLDCFLLLLLII